MSWIYEVATSTPSEVYAAIEKEAAKVNLTMYALCSAAGVDPSTVSRWNSGDQDPSFKIVRALMCIIIALREEQKMMSPKGKKK